MQYVLKEIIGIEKREYYVYSDDKICHKLKHAKVFKSMIEIDNFIKQNSNWSSSYKTIAITEKDLFKAKLANQ